jgi:hypothetical protein
VYTCGRFGRGFERAVFVFVLSIECCQTPGVEEQCASSRRLWVVTVDTSMFKTSKGARNGEKGLTVGVVKHSKAPNACPWGWIKTDTWRRPSSWPCLTTSPPFLFISVIFHAGLFFLPDTNPFFLGTCRPLQFGFTSLKIHQLPESESARARADHQGLFRLRSPHGHVISSYQPQAIPLMTQARLYTLAKHR